MWEDVINQHPLILAQFGNVFVVVKFELRLAVVASCCSLMLISQVCSSAVVVGGGVLQEAGTVI